MKNAFSVDLEDWFCAYNFVRAIPYDSWDSQILRVKKPTQRILEILDQHNTKATFFILGWIADRCPELIKSVAAAGHEIATHGYAHIMVKEGTEKSFEEDLVNSLRAIRRSVDVPVVGYRAPSFSVSPQIFWIFDLLAKHGIKYDSSVFPISFHPEYGAKKTSLSIHNISDALIEFPLSCFTVLGKKVPCCGGGYFRLFPYSITAYGIRRCNKENRPAVFYIHPWEIDVDQPRIKDISLTKRLRHYVNLDKTERRLHRLLTEFEFTTLSSILRV